MLKLGFHCLGLLKQRWTPSQFYTKHCLLSPQRSLSRDLEPTNQISTPPHARVLCRGPASFTAASTRVFPNLAG